MGNAVGQHVGYDYDLLGNRSQLVYPDGRTVTYTYDMDNRLVQVEDWDSGVTGYEYDGIGRLITTTLPNQVTAQNSYDAAHHLTQLRYTGPGDILLAEFQYQVDGLGQRQVVTETLLNPAYEEVVEAFVAADGLLVLEAENGLVTPGLNGQTWVSQTSQSGYAGESYLRALPDIGQLYEVDELGDSPKLTYPIYAPESADYTVWVRAMATGDAHIVHLNSIADQQVLLKPALNLEDTNDNDSRVAAAR